MMMLNKRAMAVVATLAFAGIFSLGCGSRYAAPPKNSG